MSNLETRYRKLWTEQDSLMCDTSVPVDIARERITEINVEQSRIRRDAEAQGLDIDFNKVDSECQCTRNIPESSIYA